MDKSYNWEECTSHSLPVYVYRFLRTFLLYILFSTDHYIIIIIPSVLSSRFCPTAPSSRGRNESVYNVRSTSPWLLRHHYRSQATVQRFFFRKAKLSWTRKRLQVTRRLRKVVCSKIKCCSNKYYQYTYILLCIVYERKLFEHFHFCYILLIIDY